MSPVIVIEETDEKLRFQNFHQYQKSMVMDKSLRHVYSYEHI